MTMTAATPQWKNGKVRSRSRRHDQARQVESERADGLQEQGYEGFEATPWYGMVGPEQAADFGSPRRSTRRQHVLAIPMCRAQCALRRPEDGGGSTQKFSPVHHPPTETPSGRRVKDADVKGRPVIC